MNFPIKSSLKLIRLLSFTRDVSMLVLFFDC